MPKRPRSHQLEDISIRKFAEVLPAQWVVRDVPKDYGHDLEVEIFTDDGSSTGYIFRVQIRATDDVSRKQKLSIKTDQLRYFDHFDIPTAIVRYCSKTDELYFIWIFNVEENEKRELQKTITINFLEDDLFTIEAAKSLPETLRVLEAIRNSSSRSMVIINCVVCPENTTAADRYSLRREIDKLIDIQGNFHHYHETIVGIPVSVMLNGNRLTVSIDCMLTLAFEGETFVLEKVIPNILYTLGFYFMALGAEGLARSIAITCLNNKFEAPAFFMADALSHSLSDDLLKATDMAIINNNHIEGSYGYRSFLHFLISAPETSPDRLPAMAKFIHATIKDSEEKNDQIGLGAAKYSFANFLSALGDSRASIKLYNQARKHRPEYMKASYFWNELAGNLFHSGRFRMAAKIYEQMYKEDPSPKLTFCLADTYLFLGKFNAAQKLFSEYQDKARLEMGISPAQNMRISDDIYRYELACWFEQFYGAEISRNVVGARCIWKEFTSDKKNSEEFFTSILAQDPLDSSANFNLALNFINESGRPSEAMWLFWAAALYNPEDAASWKNAYFSAHKANNVEFMVLSLSQLIYHCGSDGYDMLRKQSMDAGIPADVHADIDALASQYLQSHRNSRPLGARGYMVTDAELFDDGLAHLEIGS